MEIKELVTKFGFEVDEKPLNDLEKGIDSIKKGLLGLGVSIGLSVGALFEFAHSTAETRESMLKLAEQAGMSIESFSKLAAAAKLGHMDVEEFGMAFTFLNRNLYKVSQGGFEATKAFNALGISQNKLRSVGFKTDAVLQLIAERAQAMPNGFKKSALMVEVFGRAGAKMIPFLNRLKEFQEVGAKMGVGITQEQAEQSEEFMMQFAELGMILKGIKNAVSNELIPVFTKLLHGTNEWLLANRAIIKANLLGFAKALGKYLQDAFFWARQFANAFMDVVKVFGGAEKVTRAFLTTIGLLSAASVLFGIGKVAKAVYGLATAFSVADAAAFAVPLAIGAVIAVLALLAEDIYSYFNGKDSVFGMLVEKFPTAGKLMVDGILETIAGFKFWFDFITAGVKDLIKLFGVLADVVMHPLDNLQKLQEGIMDGANSLMKGAWDNVTGMVGMSPSSAPVGGGNTSNASNVNVSAPINVTVPPGTPPGQVAGAVQAGVSDGLGSLLRSTRRATAGGVAY